MKLQPEQANLISVFVRKLKQGKTYDDFRKAWFPENGFGFPVRVINAINENDKNEIISIGLMKLSEEEMDETIERITEQESMRHSKISEIIESTMLKGIYRIVNDDDLS